MTMCERVTYEVSEGVERRAGTRRRKRAWLRRRLAVGFVAKDHDCTLKDDSKESEKEKKRWEEEGEMGDDGRLPDLNRTGRQPIVCRYALNRP